MKIGIHVNEIKLMIQGKIKNYQKIELLNQYKEK